MLTPKKKITKKELKHDPLLDSLEKGKDFYEENSKQIMSGIVAIAVILLLGWGWTNSMETAKNEAMLANTKATLAAVNGFDENVIAELESVFLEYGNDANVIHSNYQLGIARMNEGDYAGARELFSQLAKKSDKQMQVAGKLKLAYLNEVEGSFAEAADLYAEIADMDMSMVSDYAKIQAGHAYLASGNSEQVGIIVADLLAEEPVGKYKEHVKYLEGKVLEK